MLLIIPLSIIICAMHNRNTKVILVGTHFLTVLEITFLNTFPSIHFLFLYTIMLRSDDIKIMLNGNLRRLNVT